MTTHRRKIPAIVLNVIIGVDLDAAILDFCNGRVIFCDLEQLETVEVLVFRVRVDVNPAPS
eukprot:scaffold41448_cov199-Amphora_coffeaeformis.AAC.7